VARVEELGEQAGRRGGHSGKEWRKDQPQTRVNSSQCLKKKAGRKEYLGKMGD